MSSNTAIPTPAEQSSQSTATSTTAAAAATGVPTSPTAPAAAAAGGAGSFTSMADLKAKAPQVYKAMMQSIAMNICNDSQDWSNLIVEAMQEGSDQTS